MPVSEAQKLAAGEVVLAVSSTVAPGRGRRRIASIFMELPDKEAWQEYYEVRYASRTARMREGSF